MMFFLKYAGELHIIALRRKVHRPHQFKLKTYVPQKKLKSKKSDDKAMRRSQPGSAWYYILTPQPKTKKYNVDCVVLHIDTSTKNTSKIQTYRYLRKRREDVV